MSRFVAMVTYVPRACLPPKRLSILAVPVVSAVLLGFLTHAIDEPSHEALGNVVDIGMFGLILPLGALVIGDAILGAEVRNGALPFTWLSPVRFGEIVAARWLGGWIIGMLSLLPACLVAALVAGVPDALPALAVSVALTIAAHLGLFVLIGATTRRAAVWSLAVVLLGERLLGEALTGVAGLSPTWMGRSVFFSWAPEMSDRVRDGVPTDLEAVLRLVLITAVCLGLATWRLAHVRLTGARD